MVKDNKQNYKYTEEFGYIPKDWEINTFDKCFNFLQTNTYSREELTMEGNIKNIHYGDILITYPTILSSKDINTYLVGSLEFKNYRYCRNGDIIIADTAEDNTVGKAVEIQNITDKEKVIAGLHTMLCRPRKENVFSNKFLGYFINSSTYHNQLIPLITGIKVSSISKTGIKTTSIIIPPLPEQEKIAEVLSDVDSLIERTQQLIDKKKNLKIATMQKLLTPKKDWETKELSKIIKLQSGYSFNSDKFVNQGIPIIRISNIYNDKVLIDNDTVYYDKINISNDFIIKKDDILIAMSGATTGKIGVYKYPFFSYQNQRVGKFVPINKNINMLYIKQFLKTDYFINEMNKSISQGAQPNISNTQIEKIIIHLPKKEEQDKIATILSDMDSEIEKLEQEFSKYKDLKIGMMQELLTGKTRLM